MRTVERAKGRLIAHCFFANGKVTYENYQDYYTEVNNPAKKCLIRHLFIGNTCA